jgi:hypothetical protein
LPLAAIDAIVAHVVCVAELDRLLDKLLCTCHVGTAAQTYQEAYQAHDQEKPADNTGFRKRIGAGLENLWHRMLTNGAPAWSGYCVIDTPETSDFSACPNSNFYHVVKKGASVPDPGTLCSCFRLA